MRLAVEIQPSVVVVGGGNKFRAKRVIVVAPIKITRTRSAGSAITRTTDLVPPWPRGAASRAFVLAVTMQMHLPGYRGGHALRVCNGFVKISGAGRDLLPRVVLSSWLSSPGKKNIWQPCSSLDYGTFTERGNPSLLSHCDRLKLSVISLVIGERVFFQ